MPIIYLSPSTQDWNHYVNGGTEEEWMNQLFIDQSESEREERYKTETGDAS